MTKYYVGTSGFSYDHWEKVFYPEHLAKSERLRYYSKYFNSVELNVSFYRVPTLENFKLWRDETPSDFCFAIKGPEAITHYRRLQYFEEILGFFLKNLSGLGEKAKVILWQFSSKLSFDAELLNNFCKSLEKSTHLKSAFEFRNKSWFNNETAEILSKYNGTFVLADWPFRVTIGEEDRVLIRDSIIEVPITANFTYTRRHGVTSLYRSSYSIAELEKEALEIKKSSSKGVGEIYVFFNNDALGNAVFNAKDLGRILSENKIP